MTTRRITRLLIANRGEIACRIQRTAHDMGISTVAVYADDDCDARFVEIADVAVPLRGRTAAQTYLEADKILDAARLTGADAVHPGYGFLSENAEFARACADAGLVFVGPSPEILHSMGLKDIAKSQAAHTGLPVLPDAVLGDDESTWLAAADTVGLPLLVKATAGGGGKGMRLVSARDDLLDAVRSARREASNSFGNPTVFLERYLPRARHIEVQIFGDEAGNAVHLFERECSVQRRHQKVIEESPASRITPELREAMTSVSVDLVKSLGYVGAGTIEFLVDDATQMFYFLEMNTRLQVEHGVTELVTGVDLVQWQLRVAAGHNLPLLQADIKQTGHAVEARLCAEDPADDYRPTSGRVYRYSHESREGVRFDEAFDLDGLVPPFFDSMVAKVMAWAPERDTAIGRLRRALRELRIHGITTNRDHLQSILLDDAFSTGDIWTGYLDERTDLAQLDAVDRWLHLATLVAASTAARRASGRTAALVPGWRALPESPMTELTWRDARTSHAYPVRYRWLGNTAVDTAFTTLELDVSGDCRVVEVYDASAHAVTFVVDGRRLHAKASRYDDASWWVSVDGVDSGWLPIDRLPQPASAAIFTGSLVEVPGTVTHIDVTVGQSVEAGDRLLVTEAMKMEYPLFAGRAGFVEAINVSVGDFVSPPTVPVRLKETTQ